MTSEELAYFAGIIDGEGSITISKNYNGAKTLRGKLSVGNTDMRLLTYIKDITGMGIIVSYGEKRFTRKPCYQWHVGTKQAAELLSKVLPYLKIKRKQAWLLLEMQQNKPLPGGRPSPKAREREFEIQKEVRNLNAKGSTNRKIETGG